MSLGIPVGVRPDDDVVASRVGLHMTVHRPGPQETGCGAPMDLMQPPIGAYLADGYAARWCEKPGCFEHENAWDELVESAHPANPLARADIQARDRDRFPVLNSSRRWSIAAFLHLNGRRA
jgi:hypothetical protein